MLYIFVQIIIFCLFYKLCSIIMHESTKQFGSSKNKLSIYFFLTLSCVLDQKEKKI